MSEEEKIKELTTGFTTVAEKRKSDVHEAVYADNDLLLPTLGIVGACVLGFVLAFLSM